jgi:hypothetical protein
MPSRKLQEQSLVQLASGDRLSDRGERWPLKVALVLFVTILQLSTFFATYRMYHLIPYTNYLDVSTPWDNAIPYLRWSWSVYYFGFAYIIGLGAYGIWRFSRSALYRTIAVYSGLVIGGAILHLVIPTQAPWRLLEHITSAQHGFKETYGIEPLACFPSMHVAMAVLPCLISLFVIKSRAGRVLSVLLATAVSISVVTAKEHWLLDAFSGALLGLMAFWVWRRLVLTGQHI